MAKGKKKRDKIVDSNFYKSVKFQALVKAVCAAAPTREVASVSTFSYCKGFSKEIAKLYAENITDANLYNASINTLRAQDALMDLFEDYKDMFLSLTDFSNCLFDELKEDVARKCTLKSKNPQAEYDFNSRQEYKNSRKFRKQIFEIAMNNGRLDNDTRWFITALMFTPVFQQLPFLEKLDDAVLSDSEVVSGKKTYDEKLTEIITKLLNSRSILTTTSIFGQPININTNRFLGREKGFEETPNHLKVLGFLENFNALTDENSAKNDLFFDGFRFFDKNLSATTPNARTIPHILKFSTERANQSSLCFDEKYARALMMAHKTPVKNKDGEDIVYRFTKNDDNGKQIKVEKRLYELSDVKGNPISENHGYFCTVYQDYAGSDACDFSLFYICDPEGNYPIQLARLDMVSKEITFTAGEDKNGNNLYKTEAASHNQRGNENIKTFLHLHTYNLIDAVVKNPNKKAELGKMDISFNFNSGAPLYFHDAQGLFEEIILPEHAPYNNSYKRPKLTDIKDLNNGNNRYGHLMELGRMMFMDPETIYRKAEEKEQ